MGKELRILFFSPDLGVSGIDGPLVNAINVAQSFAEAKLPAIFIYNGKQDVFDRFVATGADVRRVDFPIGGWQKHLNPLYRREYSRKLAQFIAAERIDVVHLFMRASYVMSYLKGSEVLRVAEQVYSSPNLRPIRLFANGFSIRPRKLLNAWYRKHVRFNYSAADLVVTLGHSQQLAATKVYGVPPMKTVIVPLGAGRQLSGARPGSVRREFGIPDDVKIVLSVGRITRAKGVEEFGEIARILNSRGKTYWFLFAGLSVDDNYEVEIRRRYGKYVTFMGHRDDIASCYGDADLYLHPSHREGMPLAIIESMEFGLPAVAWDIPGCNELVTDGENGVLLKFGDVGSAADAVEMLLEDQGSYDRASAAATRRFNENHDISEYAPGLMDVYHRAMADKSRG